MCSARRTTRRERFEKASAEDEHPVEILAPDGAHYVPWFSGTTDISRIGSREARAGKPSLLVIKIGGSTRSKGRNSMGSSRVKLVLQRGRGRSTKAKVTGCSARPSSRPWSRRGVAAVTGLFMAFPLVWCASPSWANASTNGQPHGRGEPGSQTQRSTR
jgi:anti-sigma factor RsiW